MKYERRLAAADPTQNLVFDMENKSKFEVTKTTEVYQKTAFRVSMFLFVPIICSLPWAILIADQRFILSSGFLYFATFMAPLEGLFNALIYLANPSVLFCWEMYRSHLSRKYVVKYHSIDDAGNLSDEPTFPKKGISIKWEKRALMGVRFSVLKRVYWPNVTYYIIKTLISRKRDFIVKTRKSKKEVESNQIKEIVKNPAAIEENMPNQANYEDIFTCHKPIAQELERDENFAEEYEALKSVDI